MSRPAQQPIVLQSEKIDIGNTGANVACLLVPCQMIVDSAQVMIISGATSNCTVSFDSLSSATQGAEDVGAITVTASAAALDVFHDLAGRGVRLYAGDKILVQVDEAGDSGEKARVSVLGFYEPESDANETSKQTLTA